MLYQFTTSKCPKSLFLKAMVVPKKILKREQNIEMKVVDGILRVKKLNNKKVTG